MENIIHEEKYMSTKEKKVMLIYKNVIISRIAREMLRKIGFSQFIEVDNRSDALANLMAGNIDLVVSDQSLEVDGGGISRDWRNLGNSQIIPFVIISKQGSIDIILAAGRAGVDEYIVLPCSLSSSEQKEFVQAVCKKLDKFL